MPGEKGDVGDMVGDLMPSSSSSTMSTVRFVVSHACLHLTGQHWRPWSSWLQWDEGRSI